MPERRGRQCGAFVRTKRPRAPAAPQRSARDCICSQCLKDGAGSPGLSPIEVRAHPDHDASQPLDKPAIEAMARRGPGPCRACAIGVRSTAQDASRRRGTPNVRPLTRPPRGSIWPRAPKFEPNSRVLGGTMKFHSFVAGVAFAALTASAHAAVIERTFDVTASDFNTLITGSPTPAPNRSGRPQFHARLRPFGVRDIRIHVRPDDQFV